MKYAALVDAIEAAKTFLVQAEALLEAHKAETVTPVHRRPDSEVTTPVKLVKATKDRAITLTRAIWAMGHR